MLVSIALCEVGGDGGDVGAGGAGSEGAFRAGGGVEAGVDVEGRVGLQLGEEYTHDFGEGAARVGLVGPQLFVGCLKVFVCPGGC